MATKVQLPANEEIIVQADRTGATNAAPRSAAPSATVVNRGEATITQEMLDAGINLVKKLDQALMQAHEAKMAADQLQDVSLGGFAGLVWEVATAGPFNLSPTSLTLSPNRVIQGVGVPGPNPPNVALMIGISYTGNPTTTWGLADKDYDARFTVVNLSNVTSGLPVVAQTSPIFKEGIPTAVVLNNPLNVGDFPNSPFEYFMWYFIPRLTTGADQELYEVNFTVDLVSDTGTPPPALLGAGFSNWNFDPYGGHAIPIGVPGDSPHWQKAISGRFLVNDPNN